MREKYVYIDKKSMYSPKHIRSFAKNQCLPIHSRSVIEQKLDSKLASLGGTQQWGKVGLTKKNALFLKCHALCTM